MFFVLLLLQKERNKAMDAEKKSANPTEETTETVRKILAQETCDMVSVRNTVMFLLERIQLLEETVTTLKKEAQARRILAEIRAWAYNLDDPVKKDDASSTPPKQ
jgi:ribosomal protein S15P/S13E